MSTQQHVNLYQPMFRRQEKKLSAKKLLGVVAGAALFLTAVYGYVRWDVYALESQLADLESQYQLELRRVDELNRQFPVRLRSKSSESKLARLRTEQKAKQNLIKLLQGSSTLGNNKGFSGHMEGIARQRVSGMWVTSFALNDGGESIDIAGSSIKPELVPRFLQNLSSENSFRGAEFRVFKMQRDENKRSSIDFQLKTRTRD